MTLEVHGRSPPACRGSALLPLRLSPRTGVLLSALDTLAVLLLLVFLAVFRFRTVPRTVPWGRWGVRRTCGGTEAILVLEDDDRDAE